MNGEIGLQKIPALGESLPLLHLLPAGYLKQKVNPKALAINIENYACVVDLSLEALINLKNKKLWLYDPLAKENACQIRSALIPDIFLCQDHELTIESCLRSLENLSQALKNADKLIDGWAVFSEFLEKNKLLVDVPKMLLAAVLAYQLCMTKIVKPTRFFKKDPSSPIEVSTPEEIDISLLKVNGKTLNKSFVKKMDSHARKTLSEYSVWYVQHVCNQLPVDLEVEELKNWASSKNIKKNEFGLSTLPCFVYMDILYRHALRKKIPFVLKVTIINPESLSPEKEGKIFLYYQSMNGIYSAQENFLSPSTDEGVIVMEGFSMGPQKYDKEKLKEVLLSMPLEDNVLGNDAAHHQYAGDKKDLERPKIVRCEKYREIALKEGFCKENPALCYIEHFYPDTLARQLKLWSEK